MQPKAAMNPRTTRQIRTRYRDEKESGLVTELGNKELRSLRDGEVLVEVRYVPIHGSFWLASHPSGLHPRKQEFLQGGSFVFGNGGVGRVVASSTTTASAARPGDYVTIFGHTPCSHYNCYACTVLHRYTECEFKESTIIGHGKGAHDGTYAEYVILPPFSYEICYRSEEAPSPSALSPFMHAFLLADVRNALTRHPDTLRNRRMLLFGAGQSGHIAAYLHLRSTPEAKLVVVDPSPERAASLKSLDPDAVETYVLPENIVRRLNSREDMPRFREELGTVIEGIREKMLDHFGGRLCNLLFDASSGNTAPLWDNARILSPACHAIPFGFGSDYVLLNQALIQVSGLNLLMSRGVGNLRNRREVIELIKAGGSSFLDRYLTGEAKRLDGLDQAISFIREQHDPPRMLHEIPHAYMLPNPG
jgi:threonine dehydrogenase-like Zn-dependent dehydrogenase